MKKVLVRALSVFMAIFLIIGIVPLNVFAQNTNNSGSYSDDGTEVYVEGTSGLNLILSNLDQTNTDSINSGCSVIDVSIIGKEAHVLCETLVSCKLVVALYDEDTEQMLGSGITDIAPETQRATVIIDIAQMPEKYLIKAFMLDNNLAPLSNTFTFFEHTSVYEKFMSVSPDDFDDERVIPLGEDINQSFAALSTNVELPAYSEEMVIEYNNDDEKYHITNPTNEIKKLKKGDTVYYQIAEDDFVLFKVEEITVSGDSVVITEDVDISLEDAFDYIRYDEGTYLDDISSEDISTGRCLEPIGDLEIIESKQNDGDISTQANEDYGDEGSDISVELVSTKYNLSYPNKDSKDEKEKNFLKLGYKIEGSIGLTVGASARLHWDIRIGPDYFEYRVEVKTNIVFDVSISGSLDIVNKDEVYWQVDGKDKKGDPKGFKLGKSGFLRLYIKVYPIVSVSAEIDLLKVEVNIVKGSIINSTDGFNKINFDEKKLLDGDFLKVTVTIKIGGGVEFEVAPKFAKDKKDKKQKIIASVKVTVEVYLKLELKPDDTDENLHPCKICLSGTADFCIDGSVTIHLKLFKVLNKIKKESIKKFLDKNGKLVITALSLSYSKDLGECYIGFDKNWSFQIGFGKECPHKRTKVTIYVINEDDKKPIEGVKIIFSSSPYTTNENGVVELYLKPGTHTIKAVYDKKTKSETVSVSEFEKEITFIFSKDDDEDEPGVDVSGKTTSSYLSGTLTISGTGNMQDYTGFGSAPWDAYKDSIEHVVIESGVTGLGDYAFAQCTNLETVTIADTVTDIGMATFYQCDSLQSLKLPDSVKTIDDYAFYGCYSMTNLSLGSVETIGSYAFAQCTALTKVSVPATTTSIGDSAFGWCQKMKTIDIKNKNCTIYDSANTIYVDTTINAPAGSKAQSYASKYNRKFSSLTTQSAVETTKIYDSYSITYSSCVAGTDYILLNVTGYGSGFELTTSNLEFIDQLTADSNGDVKTLFVPRKFVSNSTTLLIGDFGNGTETRIITPTLVGTSIEIDNNPGTLTINFKEGVRLTASVISPIDGCYIQWYVNDTAYSTGDTFEYEHFDRDTTVSAKLVDENGNVVVKDGKEVSAAEQIKVKAGFFQKLIAFFKFTLFGMVVFNVN